MSIMAKTPSGYKKIGSAYLGERPVDKVFNANGDVVYALQRELTGVPPLLFKGKEQSELLNYRICGNTETKQRDYSGSSPLTVPVYDGELYNYRIYGNTANGESVGEKTANLFNGEIMIGGISDSTGGEVDGISTRLRTSWIKVEPSETYSFNLNNLDYKIHNIYVYDESKAFVYTSEISSNSVTVTVSSLASYVRFVFRKNDGSETVIISDCREKFMLNTGSTPLPYEPYGYKLPITLTNSGTTSNETIYLPEPIKMVGSEAEYVDYYSQTLHRVRKNLLQNTAISRTINGVTFTVNSDGSVTCNGQANSLTIVYPAGSNFSLSKGTYKLTGCPINGTGNTFCQDVYSSSINLVRDYGDGAEFNVTTNDIILVRLIIFSGYTCNNLTFYPMIRKADISDDTYEPYIETVDVPITIPALPISAGTNTVTVNTTVQPSNVEVSTDENVSVGDLVTSGQHAGEYKVDVTVEGKNLFDLNTWANTIRSISGDGVMSISGSAVSITSVNAADCYTEPYANSQTGVYKMPVKPNTNYTVNWYGSNYRIMIFENGIFDYTYNFFSDAPQSFTTHSDTTFLTIRFGVNLTNPVGTTATISEFIISEGSEATPYEPYQPPITTNLYLPEPIKMVGSEAEYVDYAEQKQHRVRKNLFDVSTITPDCYVDNEGQIIRNDGIDTSDFIKVSPNTNYTYKGVVIYNVNTIRIAYYDQSKNFISRHFIIGNAVDGETVTTPSNCEYVKLSYDKVITNLMLNSGSEPLPYEPYIESTEVDVTLPALPTIKGTNEMSVDTEVQPSRMDIKGRIKSLT